MNVPQSPKMSTTHTLGIPTLDSPGMGLPPIPQPILENHRCPRGPKSVLYNVSQIKLRTLPHHVEAACSFPWPHVPQLMTWVFFWLFHSPLGPSALPAPLFVSLPFIHLDSLLDFSIDFISETGPRPCLNQLIRKGQAVSKSALRDSDKVPYCGIVVLSWYCGA